MAIEAERSFKHKKAQQDQQPKVKYENLPRLPFDRALGAHQEAIARGAKCTECPLFGLRAGPVLGELVPNARLVVIGETPGQNEIDQKRPLMGKSGEVLNSALLDGGVAREECTITYAISCRPPEELKAFEYRLRVMHESACERAKATGAPQPPPPKLPYECCYPRLQRDVNEHGAKTVLAIGSLALRAISDIWNVPHGSSRKVRAGEVRIASLKKQLGSPITLPDGTIVIASYHPAFAMRPGSRHYMHVIKKFIARAAEIARRGRIDWSEPEYILDPSVETIERVLRSMTGRRKTIDIETDRGKSPFGDFDPFSCRIRCIGFGAYLQGDKGPETVIAVPIRYMSGAEWWPDPADKKRVIQACMDALNDESPDPDTGEPAMLVGHNLAFDTAVLLRYKLLTRRDRLYHDSMLLHHDTPDNDLPHDLGFVGARYFEVPAWKSGADDKYYSEVTDHDLHLYNCLSGDTRVVLEDRSTMPIKDIVRHQLQVKVLSQASDGQIEARRVVAWQRQRVKNQKWIEVRTGATRPHERGIICTPDHQIYTQRGKVRADELQITDTLFLSELAFSEEQTQAIMGSLLGDSRLIVSPTLRSNMFQASGAAIDGVHAQKSGLTPYKIAALSPHLIQSPTQPAIDEVLIKGVRTKKDAIEPYRTRNLRQLRQLMPLFYDEQGRRRLRIEALNKLGPIGLAWWFMDDGCRQNGARRVQNNNKRGGLLHNPDSMTFATNAFPREDIEAAVAWFRERYGATNAGSDNVIRIGYKAAVKLAAEIAPYIPENLRYKLPRGVDYGPVRQLAPSPGTALNERIVSVKEFEPFRRTATQRSSADTRWCITVEGNHNFFTTQGLVKNCRDVTTTMRLYHALTDEIYRWATVDQYLLDRRLAPITRDMGELGLFIDEVKRGELSLRMNTEAYARLLKLKELTNDPKFNPSSAPQIRKFLFVTKKHIPVINTQGKDWEEGEDPSTNTIALTKLVAQQGCDKHTKDFVNTLLEYRAYMKLKGTYIDKLRVHYPDWKREFGLDVPMLPEVRGPVWKKYTKWRKERSADDPVDWVEPPSKEAVAEERWSAEWAEVMRKIPHDLPKAERRQAKRERTARINMILDRIEDGVWEEAVVIPARPALSRLHITYKLHVVPSGRMSSSPNCQNWPKFGKANMHEMIVAPPGHVMVGADLDQVELRLYAAIAGDKLLIDAFTKPGPDGKPFDPHSLNAASLFAKKFNKTIIQTYLLIMGLPDMHAALFAKAAIEQANKEGTPCSVSPSAIDATLVKRFNAALKAHTDLSGKPNVSAIAVDLAFPVRVVEALIAGSKKGDKEKKKLRGYAKTFAYLECYGGEADKLYGFMSTARDKGTGALMFPDLKEEDVQEWHKEWHRNHPETRAWQDACQRIARLEGFTATPLGSYRKRYFMGGPNKPGATFNHVIQGAAAEIANAALLKIAEKIPYLKWSPFTGLCLQVHDYVGVYVPKEYGEIAKQIIEDALNSEISNGIKITASAVISDGLATQ